MTAKLVAKYNKIRFTQHPLNLKSYKLRLKIVVGLSQKNFENIK